MKSEMPFNPSLRHPRDVISSPEYDPEVFEFAYNILFQEYAGAELAEKPKILERRAQDVLKFSLYGQAGKQGTTQHYDQFGFHPIARDEIRGKRNISLLTGREQRGEYIETFQYGPSRCIVVKPNQMVEVSLGEQDIIISGAFTACTAIMIDRGDTSIFSHVTTLSEVPNMVSALYKPGDHMKLGLAHAIPKDTECSRTFSDQYNQSVEYILRQVREVSDVEDILTYPYVSPETALPDGVFYTAFTLGKHFAAGTGYNHDWERRNDEKELIFTPAGYSL